MLDGAGAGQDGGDDRRVDGDDAVDGCAALGHARGGQSGHGREVGGDVEGCPLAQDRPPGRGGAGVDRRPVGDLGVARELLVELLAAAGLEDGEGALVEGDDEVGVEQAAGAAELRGVLRHHQPGGRPVTPEHRAERPGGRHEGVERAHEGRQALLGLAHRPVQPEAQAVGSEAGEVGAGRLGCVAEGRHLVRRAEHRHHLRGGRLGPFDRVHQGQGCCC